MKLHPLLVRLKPGVGDRLVCLLAAVVVLAGAVELAGLMLLTFR